MKTVITTVLLIVIIGNIEAVDIESYQFIDHLRNISKAGKPEIYEDAVIFTAPSSHRRVGISFAHDGYAKVHWFRVLMIPRDTADYMVNGRVQRHIDTNIDSGVSFHLEPIPGDIQVMDYRMVIDGLWTTDPLNPLTVTGPSGVAASRVLLHEKPKPSFDQDASGIYRFIYRAPPGETITVGGSFNNWDPFMYELKETSPGFYTLALPLPPGTFQYVYFHRGDQVPDPANFRRIYTPEGRIVSEAVVVW